MKVYVKKTLCEKEEKHLTETRAAHTILLDWTGLDWTGLDWIGLTGPGKTVR